jgi:hypothetical protein
VEPYLAAGIIERRSTLPRETALYVTTDLPAGDNAGHRLEAYVAAVGRLRSAGFDNLYCHLGLREIPALLKTYRFLKNELGAKTILGLEPPRDRDGVGEDILHETALRVGALFYEGLADALLFGPAMAAGSSGVSSSRGTTAAAGSSMPPSSAEALPWPTIERQIGIAKRALSMIGRLPFGFSLISCPTCGRCEIDIPDMARQVDGLLRKLETGYRKRGIRLEEAGGITVAVMGCNVNGPGEARGADIGIAGGRGGTGTIFMGGRPVATLPENTLMDNFERRVKELVEERLLQRR